MMLSLDSGRIDRSFYNKGVDGQVKLCGAHTQKMKFEERKV